MMKLGAINQDYLQMKSLLILLLEKVSVLIGLNIDSFRKHIGLDLVGIDLFRLVDHATFLFMKSSFQFEV